MNPIELPKAGSETLDDFVRVMGTDEDSLTTLFARPCTQTHRLNFDPEQVRNGIAQLVLTLVKLLHELLERQAIRRMEAGFLGEDEIEMLGMTLMGQAEQIERLRKEFGLEEEDLNIDLGPLGRIL